MWCKKKNNYLRSTHLRKEIATTSQILNLKNNELDQLADFLGHDISVHRQFYQLSGPTIQSGKNSKLLLALERGKLCELHGKSLDQTGGIYCQVMLSFIIKYCVFVCLLLLLLAVLNQLLQQRSTILLLGTHFPAELSSKPNQTHLNQEIKVFTIT